MIDQELNSVIYKMTPEIPIEEKDIENQIDKVKTVTENQLGCPLIVTSIKILKYFHHKFSEVWPR